MADGDSKLSGTRSWSYLEKEMVQTYEVDGVVM